MMIPPGHWPEVIGDDNDECLYLCWSDEGGYEIEYAKLVRAGCACDAGEIYWRYMTRKDNHSELPDHNEKIPVSVLSVLSALTVVLTAKHTVKYNPVVDDTYFNK